MSEWETERETERSKAVVRWVAIAILAGLLAWQRAHHAIDMPPRVFWALVGSAAAMNLFHTIFLARIRGCAPSYKYGTVAVDLVLVTAAIAWTGYSRSPFFYVYFVLLVSNCMRYGMVMSLFIALLVNVLYAVVLSLAPAAEQQAAVFGGEGLKILAFWGIALYGGGIASRIRRHLHEAAAYEETIAELRARVQSAAPEKADA